MAHIHRTGIISHTKRQPFRHAHPSRSYGFSMAQIVRQEHTERFRKQEGAT